MTSAVGLPKGHGCSPSSCILARLLDIEPKLARPRAVMYGSLALAFLIASPWVGWLPFIPLAGRGPGLHRVPALDQVRQ